jgi:hypothetical protein
LRTDAQRASPVLVHLDANNLGRLVPVEVDVLCTRRLAEQGRETLRELPDLGGIRTADAELERPTDRRAELEGTYPRHHLLELRPSQCGDDALLHRGAELEALGDNDGLREEVVRELLVERQVRRAPLPT